MSSMTIDLGGDNYLTTGPVCTGIHFGDGSENHFDLDMVGEISEWLAVAWENLAGEEYKPVLVTERGYVADEGVIAFKGKGDGVILPGERYPAIPKRAAVLPLFGDAIEMSSDPGPGTESYGREQILERGHVVDDGVVYAGEYVIPKSAIGNSLSAIKDRAAARSLVGDAIGVPQEDIPEFVDTVERLERDCE